jgi:hypothetical protein
MKKRHIYIISPLIIFLVVLILFPISGWGKSVTSNLSIKANVQPFFEFDIIQEPSRLNINQAGIKKGYVEISDGLIFSIKTNSSAGYALRLNCGDAPYLTYILVTPENNASYELHPGESIEIYMPYESPHQEVIKVRFSVYLAEGVESGKYPWPVLVSIYPI